MIHFYITTSKSERFNLELVDFSKRFHSGINVDDSWRYAGVKEPKSIIIPYLLSLNIPEGTVFDKADYAIGRRSGMAMGLCRLG